MPANDPKSMKPGDPPLGESEKSEPSTILKDYADLSAKLDDGRASDDLWKAMDALYSRLSKATPEEQQHIAALSARFHHFLPRSK